MASRLKLLGDLVFLEELEEVPPPVQDGQDPVVLAQVDSVGPEAKGIKAGGTVLVRASAIRDATRFNDLKLVHSWDIIATVD